MDSASPTVIGVAMGSSLSKIMPSEGKKTVDRISLYICWV